MSQIYRLNNVGYINRNKKISFRFNGKRYFGYEGVMPIREGETENVFLSEISFKLFLICSGVNVLTSQVCKSPNNFFSHYKVVLHHCK